MEAPIIDAAAAALLPPSLSRGGCLFRFFVMKIRAGL
jgi:hypothetical protein